MEKVGKAAWAAGMEAAAAADWAADLGWVVEGAEVADWAAAAKVVADWEAAAKVAAMALGLRPQIR